MKFRLRNIIATVAFALICAGSIGGSLYNRDNAKEAKANGAGSVIYLDLKTYINAYNIWKSYSWDGNKMYLRYYNGSSNGYSECTRVFTNSDYFWKITLSSSGYGRGGFCFRPWNSGSDNDRETVWISWNSWSSQSFNCLQTKTSQDTSANSRWEVNWLNITINTLEESSTSTSNFRIFGRPELDDWRNYYETCIRYTDSSNAVHFVKTNAVENTENNLWFNYADIPLTATGYQFVGVIKDLGHVVYYSSWVSLSSFATNALKIHYISGTQKEFSGSSNWKVSFGGFATGKAGVAICKLATETLLTCSSSALNGYGAYSNLNENFISKMSTTNRSTFDATVLSDYSQSAWEGNNKTYSDSLTKSETTYGAKVEQLQKMANSSSSGLNRNISTLTDNSYALLVTTILALVISASVGAYFLVKKKKVQ